MKSFFFAVLLSATLLSMESSVTGDWTIAGEVQGVGVDEVCAFVQTEAKLAGSCELTGKKYDTTGTVDGKKVIFKHGGEYNGDPLTLTYTGIMAEDGSFSGSIYVRSYGCGWNVLGQEKGCGREVVLMTWRRGRGGATSRSSRDSVLRIISRAKGSEWVRWAFWLASCRP